MKLHNLDIDTEGTALESHGFTIGDEGAILGILRQQMYSNPIESICREICSNCRDAHRELGNPERPIQITLPTIFNPVIKFRDFGVGISPDRMKDVYTNYGNSTKRDNNNQTGGFGLGAKTPFAYTPQFTITTICPDKKGQNIKRIYTASVGGDRKGGVHLLFEEQTIEERGTEVSFSVERKDFQAFKDGLIKSVKFWDVTPVFKNADNEPDFMEALKIDNKSILEGQNWKILENKYAYHYYSNEQLAIVDGIPYSIDIEHLRDDELLYEIAKGTSFYLYFNTGDLDLSAHREELYYSSKTIKIIKERFKEIVSVAEESLKEKLKTISSYVDAVTHVKSFYNSTKIRVGNLYWNDNLIYTDLDYYGLKLKIDNCRLDTCELSSKTQTGLSKTNQYGLLFNGRHKFVVNSNSSQVDQTALYNLIRKHGSVQVLVAKDGNIDNLIKEIKNEYHINFNDLNPLKIADFKISKTQVKNKRPKTNAHIYKSGQWVPYKVDPDKDKGYYVILQNRKTEVQLGRNLPNIKDSFSGFLSCFDFDNKLLIGIKSKEVNKIGNGFKPLLKLARERYKELKKTQLTEMYGYYLAQKESTYQDKNNQKQLYNICRSLTDENIVSCIEFVKEYEYVCEQIEQYVKLSREIRLIFNGLGILRTEPDIVGDDKLNRMTNDWINKYPLAFYCFNVWGIKHRKADVVDYIKMIDERN